MRDEADKQQRFHRLGDDYFWFASQNEIVTQRLRAGLERVENRSDGIRRIVDLGCGPGNTLLRFRGFGELYGMDYSPDALQFARNRGFTRVFTGNLESLPLQSESVDVVIALDVLEHVERDDAAMSEIRRILRPGGVFIFTVPAFMSLWRQHDVMYGHFRRYTRREFTSKITEAGLAPRECDFFKCAFFAPLWLIAKLERLGLAPRRDNFFTPPAWLSRLMHWQIVSETSSGLARHLPFGVSLICVGQRPR